MKTDVAFLPIGGTYTMDVAQAAGLAEVDGAADRRADALRLRRRLGGRRRSGSASSLLPVAVQIMTPENPFELE